MTFAAEEEERVWEEEEKERGGISLGLVDWMHHGGAKKKRSSVWLREKQTGNDGRRVENIGQRLDAEVFLNLCIH